jgi:hypothetical protein
MLWLKVILSKKKQHKDEVFLLRSEGTCYLFKNFVVCRYLAEKTIQRGDDFMGRLFYPLRSIPNAGEEKTFVLYSHSGKTQHGYITLQLSIGAKRRKTPLQVENQGYFWERSGNTSLPPPPVPLKKKS